MGMNMFDTRTTVREFPAAKKVAPHEPAERIIYDVDAERARRTAAQIKMNTLLLKKTESERRIAELETFIQSAQQAPEESPITTAARALIDSNESVAPGAPVQSWKVERDKLIEKRRIFAEAIRIQEGEVKDASSMLARAVADAREGEYLQLLKNHVKALLAVARTVEAISEFQNEFESDSLSFLLGRRLTAFSRIGRLSDKWSFLNSYLSEFVKNGGMSQSELNEIIEGSVTA
jgi:hypothetical protein